jgi:hypothetical protein
LTTPDGRTFESDGVLTVWEQGSLTVYANHGHAIVGRAPLYPGFLFLDLPIDVKEIHRTLAGVKLRVVDDSSGEVVTVGNASLSDGFTRHIDSNLREARGAVRFESLRPGVWYLTLYLQRQGGGYGIVRQTILLTPGEMRDLGDIRVVKGVSIEGRVVDTLGKPVMCALVAGDADALLESFSTKSGVNVLVGADGAFRIAEVKRGRIAIFVERGFDAQAAENRSDPWGSQVLVVDATSGPVKDVRFVLQGVTPVTLSWDLTAHVLKYCTLRIVNADGLPLASRILTAQGITRERLPAGSYTAVLGDGVKVLSETRFDVRDVPLTLTLPGPR